MRNGEKDSLSYIGENQLFGVDFHDFIQKQSNNSMYELASEFGLSFGDVKKLKKQLERN